MSAGRHNLMSLAHLADGGQEQERSGLHLDIIAAIRAGFDSMSNPPGGDPRKDALRSLWTNKVTVPIPAGAGTTDIPEQLGPRDGQIWDVAMIQVQGTFGGSVSVHLGQSMTSDLSDPNVIWSGTASTAFPPPTFRTGALALYPGDRFVIVAASGVTGPLTFTARFVQVPMQLWPEYLL